MIDTFLMSCRVIGRNIEHAMIAFVAEFARENDVKILKGEYIPTAKNKPAADMYEKFQFKKISDNLFIADLEQQRFDYPPYIKHAIKASV
jgi:predicted enzyme involved in methoxymalonyl-ACP biosynthesis